ELALALRAVMIALLDLAALLRDGLLELRDSSGTLAALAIVRVDLVAESVELLFALGESRLRRFARGRGGARPIRLLRHLTAQLLELGTELLDALIRLVGGGSQLLAFAIRRCQRTVLGGNPLTHRFDLGRELDDPVLALLDHLTRAF